MQAKIQHGRSASLLCPILGPVGQGRAEATQQRDGAPARPRRVALLLAPRGQPAAPGLERAPAGGGDPSGIHNLAMCVCVCVFRGWGWGK